MLKKQLVLVMALGVVASSATASSYITGNIRPTTERNTEYTFELGHTFDTGTTVLVEVAGDFKGGDRHVTDTTLGVEQMVFDNGNFWAAAGYHNLSLDGTTVADSPKSGQHRPLIKIGYNFDGGAFVGHRTRAHISTDSDSGYTQNRFDTWAGYNYGDYQFKLNTIYTEQRKGEADDTFNTEWRVTRFNIADTGIDPYFEVRHEEMGKDANGKDLDKNFAFAFGASYAF